MQQLVPVRKDAELPDEREYLRQHGRNGRAANAPAEAEDEQRVENRIDRHRQDRGVHRLARVPGGTQHGVQTQIHVCNDVTPQNDGHILPGIADRRIAGSEKVENRIEKNQRQQPERDSDNQVEHHDIPQNPLGRFVIPLPQAHRHQRRGAHTHQRTERRREVHQRERQGQPRNGQRPHAVPDKDAVHHVIQRRGGHRDNGRHGILNEQLADTLGSQLHRRSFYFTHTQILPSIIIRRTKRLRRSFRPGNRPHDPNTPFPSGIHRTGTIDLSIH